VGICFQDGTVHKGTGVAFIGVTDYVFAAARGAAAKLPLATGGKTGATSPAKTGFLDLLNNLLGSHQKSFPQRSITSAINVVPDLFRVDLPTISQNYTLLLLVEVYF
jgi:hypothetical protein